MGKQRWSPRSIRMSQSSSVSWVLQESGYVMPRQVLWSDLCLISFPQELDSKSTALMHRCMLFFIVIQLVIHIPLLTLEPQGSLTLVIRCFRRSSVPSSTL